MKYLCKIQLQLFPVEVCFVEFYSSSCCCFRFAEIYSDSSKAFKQLKRNLVIIDGEECLKSLLQIEEQEGQKEWKKKKIKTFNKRKFKSLNITNGIDLIMIIFPHIPYFPSQKAYFSCRCTRTGILLFIC